MRSTVTHSSPLVKKASKGKGLTSVTEKSGKTKLHLLKEEPCADVLDWYGNLPLHHAATVDPPDIKKIKVLIDEHPEGARARNQFGRLPLHCAVDKIYCNAELVQLLLEVYPEGACEEDDEGFSPLSCALRWEHSDKILKIILLKNRYQYRGLYFAMRYGKILGNMLHCMECTFSKPKTMTTPSFSASEANSCDVGSERYLRDSADTQSYSHDRAEHRNTDAPGACVSTPTYLEGNGGRSIQAGFQGGYPEIIIADDNSNGYEGGIGGSTSGD